MRIDRFQKREELKNTIDYTQFQIFGSTQKNQSENWKKEKVERPKSTHQPIGQCLDSLAESEPESTKPKEPTSSGDEENDPRREPIANDAGKNTDVLPDVIGNSEDCQLLLGQS